MSEFLRFFRFVVQGFQQGTVGALSTVPMPLRPISSDSSKWSFSSGSSLAYPAGRSSSLPGELREGLYRS